MTIKNTGGTAVNPWTATWTWPTGVSVSSGWNATVTQSGTTVSAAAPGSSPALAAGSSVTVGFTANGTATAPAAVKLGAVACS